MDKMPKREDFLLVQETAEEFGREMFERIIVNADGYQSCKGDSELSNSRELYKSLFINEVIEFTLLERFARGAASMARDAEE